VAQGLLRWGPFSVMMITSTQNEMAKVNVKDLMNTLSNIWVVEFRESERGWGSSTWVEMYDSYVEALDAVKETNKHNTSKEVPDYYIQANQPKLFADYYKIKLS
jgi:hypothetical protein